MGEAKKYSGSCHCGKVRYEVMLDLGPVLSCNCSICSRKGHLLAFVPVEQFALLSGEGALTDYQFGKKRIHHLFCSTCGISSFSKGLGPDGKEMRAVNVRCLEGVDLSSLAIEPFDGKSL